MPTAPAASVLLAPADRTAAPALSLQGYSYDDRRTILPALTNALEDCGCWLLERKNPSATQVGFRFELQLRGALDLYTALIGAGVELTRASHLGLTSLCTLRKHRRRHTEPFRVVEIHLEVSFLDEIHLAGELLPGAARA